MSRALRATLAALLLAAGSTIALAQTGPDSGGEQPSVQPAPSPPPGSITPSARPDHPEPPAAAKLPGAVPTIGLQEDPAIIRRNSTVPQREGAPGSIDVRLDEQVRQ